MRIVMFLLLIAGCTGKPDKPLMPDGLTLAKTWCGNCHSFPAPHLLDKKTWEKSVLPLMGQKLGITSYNGNYIATTNASGSISFNDWISIVNYYSSHAPDSLHAHQRVPIGQITRQFSLKPVAAMDVAPAVCLVKIDPGNKRLYAATMTDSTLLVLDQHMHVEQKLNTGKIFVDINFNEDISSSGNRTGILTNIGNFFPSADSSGTLEAFKNEGKGLKLGAQIASHLSRPIGALQCVINGEKEILVSAFGHEQGELFLLGKGLLRAFPGASKGDIVDWNHDGREDIIALFSQGDEGIFVFTNQGQGRFTDTALMRFPPAYGSTSMELADINNDGLKDIIYTCGDNYDHSRVLKSYHGVYIFINKGNKRFDQQYFFSIPGCYKAMARDFDKDGDMDIASISFFPDEKRPEESFVYLENRGELNFTPHIIKQSAANRWITMDAGDIDGDGDEDIVLGNMVFDKNKIRPSILLLRSENY